MFAICTIETLFAQIQLVERQPLATAKVMLGNFVEAGQILDDPVAQHGAPPETAARTVNEVHIAKRTFVYQQVAPLQIVMGKTLIVHHIGRPCDLPRHMGNPFPISQTHIITVGELGQISRISQFFGNQRSSDELSSASFEPECRHVD